MEEKILEIMEAGMKRRLIFSDMLELQKIARAVNLATKAHYEGKIPSEEKAIKHGGDLLIERKGLVNISVAYFLGFKDCFKWLKSQLTKQISTLPDEEQHVLLTATINSPCKTDPEYCGWINEVKGCIAQQPTLEKCKESLLELYWVKKSVEHKNKQR